MNWRNNERFQHRWIIGKTGVGKTTLLLNLALADIEAGDGLLFIDPHGDAIDTILSLFPKRRAEDLVLFDPSEWEWPTAWNPLQGITPERKAFVASSMLDTFKSVWNYTDLTTPTLDQTLYNGIASLLDVPDGSLLGLKFMLTSETYRTQVKGHITDPIIKDFWNDFELLPAKDKREMVRSTLNKIGHLLSDPRIRHTIGQSKSAFDLENVLNKGKVLLCRLPQGKLGLQKTSIIGSLLLAQVHATALERSKGVPFHIYIDESHHFAGPSLMEMLSGIRKFNVSLTLANQYLDQMSKPFQSAVIGNVGTKVGFRSGTTDSDRLLSEFPSNNVEFPLSELPPHTARIITPSDSYTMEMDDLAGTPDEGLADKLRKQSRRKYGSPRDHVEKKLLATIERMQNG